MVAAIDQHLPHALHETSALRECANGSGIPGWRVTAQPSLLGRRRRNGQGRRRIRNHRCFRHGCSRGERHRLTVHRHSRRALRRQRRRSRRRRRRQRSQVGKQLVQRLCRVHRRMRGRRQLWQLRTHRDARRRVQRGVEARSPGGSVARGGVGRRQREQVAPVAIEARLGVGVADHRRRRRRGRACQRSSNAGS